MVTTTSYYLALSVFIVIMLYVGEAFWRTRKTFKYREAQLTWILISTLIFVIIAGSGIFGFIYAYLRWL